MALLLIFSIALNVLSLTKFDNIFEKFFGSQPSGVRGDTLGADVDYYKSDFKSATELYKYEEKKVAESKAETKKSFIKTDRKPGPPPMPKKVAPTLWSTPVRAAISASNKSGSLMGLSNFIIAINC
jgi:hypothetical protein